jgi:lipopolysaccharide/colanic/teichoic acid biosynthesis glycosyltransferase
LGSVAEVRSQSPHATRPATPSPGYGPGRDDEPEIPRASARLVKHALDRLTAACGLIVTAPLMAAVALGLRSATGQVLRREERVGEGGRTIVVRSFAISDALRERSGMWRLVAGTGLSTLPQLWSVLRGEMSIIGPRPREHGRPPPPMRPGLTGLAQLEQLERWLSIAEQIELDADYARTWSLALDARIVWRTLWAVLR